MNIDKWIEEHKSKFYEGGNPVVYIEDLRELLKTHVIVPLEPADEDLARIKAALDLVYPSYSEHWRAKHIYTILTTTSEPPKPTEYKDGIGVSNYEHG